MALRPTSGWRGLIHGGVAVGLLFAHVVTTPAQPAATRPPREVRLALDAARPVRTGQFLAGSKAQTIQFAKPVRGRYFGLDCLSALFGQPYAAIAELDLLDEAGEPISRDGWTIAFVDSEEREREDQRAANVMDGQTNTCWHTRWSADPPPPPHRLILDLGRAREIAGFRYLPNQTETNATGFIKDYAVYIGDYLKAERLPADLLPERCFLFSYFTDDDRDGLHVAWSMDGYRWDAMRRGQSLLKPRTGLMRDPFLLLAPDGKFHLVWTADWVGTHIGYASSPDLIDWSETRTIPVMAHEPATVNCWAPEAFWDAGRKEFVIFWSSAVTNRFRETAVPGDTLANQRLYCTTTKDFEHFSPTRLFYDPGFSLIDATHFAANGEFHLVFKEETAQPPAKVLRLASGSDPQGPFGAAGAPFSPQWVEGPSVLAVGGEFIAHYRFYGGAGRRGAMKSADLQHWEDASDRLMLPDGGMHQGALLDVSRERIVGMARVGLVELGTTPEAVELGVGDWMWTTNLTDKQTCRLWRSFDVPADTLVASARLRITADNGYRLLLDGREIGRGSDMNLLTEFDLTPVLSPGAHVLAVEAFNDSGLAGVILGLQVQFSNGRILEVLSDDDWRVAPRDNPHWQAQPQPGEAWSFARVLGFGGRQVWPRLERIIPAPPLQPLVTHFWQRGWFLVLLLSVGAIVAGFSVRQALQLAVQSRSQRLLERERARIARDMHDDLGAGLTQLTLEGELILRDAPLATDTHRQVDALCGRARSLLGAMDEIVWAVNPRRDTVQDFASFVCEHAQQYLGSTSLRCRLEVPDDLPATPLDLPARRNLLLAVKEAVRNAARHSGGDEVSLQVRVNNHTLEVIVGDNGRGFDLAKSPAARNGLRNMQDRMADVGGDCGMDTAPDQGCRVTFSLPLSPVTLGGNKLSKLGEMLFRKRKSTATRM